MTILHITTPELWAAGVRLGRYEHPSLSREGFIHCSTHEQLEATLLRHFAGQDRLIALEIDPALLSSALRWEASHGEPFPHIYGPLNLDAVSGTFDPRQPR
jgi:uncharacterized protein (DUF952 family)